MPKPKGNPLRQTATNALNNWMDMFPEWGKTPIMQGHATRKLAHDFPGMPENAIPLQNMVVDMFDAPPYTSKYPGIDVDPSIKAADVIAGVGAEPTSPFVELFGESPSIMFEGGNAALRPHTPPPVEGLPSELLPPTVRMPFLSGVSSLPPTVVKFSPSGRPPLSPTVVMPPSPGASSSGGSGLPGGLASLARGSEDLNYDAFDGKTPKGKTPKGKTPFGGKKKLAAVAGVTGLALGAGMLGSNKQMAGEGSQPKMAGVHSSPKNTTNFGRDDSGFSTFPFDVDMGKVGEVDDSEALARYLRETAQTAAGKNFKQIGRTPGDNSANEKKDYQAFLNRAMQLVEDLAKKKGVEYNPQEVYQMAFTKWQDNNRPKKK